MSKDNNLVSVDFETYYDSEYSLSKMSVWNYLHDSRFNAYLVAVYDGEDLNYTGSPEQFDWSLLSGRNICAHNASFDEAVYNRLVETGKIKVPVLSGVWTCTADLAAWLGVKRDLATASQILLGETLSKAVRDGMKGRSASECLGDEDVLKYGNKDAVTCYRLAERYLKDWPEKEQRVSRLNREAGYRGMALDVPLVLAGIRTLAPKLAQAEASLPWVAQGEKPLSPNALKAYGASVGIPVPASLAKTSEDFINWVALYGDKYPWVRAAGEYRSINTLLLRVKALRDGRDKATNRFPYALKYMGAATGRFCLPGTAEVLTPTGWRELRYWKGMTPIVQWEPSGTLKMLPATANKFEGGGSMILGEGRGLTMLVTPEHTLPTFGSRGNFRAVKAEDAYGKRAYIPVGGMLKGNGTALSPDQVRLWVAAQADGHVYKCDRDSSWLFGFKKERKFLRLKELLDTLRVQYRSRTSSNGVMHVAIQTPDAPWYLSKTFSLGLLMESSVETREAFIEEIAFWDGTVDHRNGSITYNTTSKENAYVVATVAHLVSMKSNVAKRVRQNTRWADCYRVSIFGKRTPPVVSVQTWSKQQGCEFVYCPTTETGYFLCRYKGDIFVTGNSGGGSEGAGKVNLQNMPSKVMFGVDVRPMFIAAPGKTLIIADYNQVEARYLLWVAGDKEALVPCFAGKSVYQAYAEKVGICTADVDLKTSDKYMYKYVKAKILGSGFGTGGPKFKAFAKMYGVELTDEQAAQDIYEYRRDNAKIVAFWRSHQEALAYSARRKDPTHEVELKSGRVLTYWEPRLVGREIEVYQTRGHYKTRVYGGKLTENEVQASCRDILCDAWLACADAGFLPVLNVHDELVFEVPEDEAPQIVPEIRRLMTTCSPWAEGLPLGVDITVSKFYTK